MKKTETMVGILTVIFLAVFGIVRFVLPDREMSEKENRVLKQMPSLTAESLLSGDWGTAFEAYMTDQFPLRDNWLGLKAATEAYALQRKELHGVYLTSGGRLIPKAEPPEDVFIRNLNALARIKERFSVPATVIIPTTAASVLSDLLSANAQSYDETLIIEAVRDAAVEVLDIMDALRAVGEDAYFRTDHHWTMRGAYEAYAAYIDSIGMEPYPLDTFERVTVTDAFYGTSYAKACLWNLPPEPIEVLTPPGGYTADSLFDADKLSVYDKYAYFLGGNQPLYVIESNAGTGRVLAMVKDSYAHILAPLLSLHFDKIVLLDPRYVNTDPYVLLESYEPTDLLVMFNAGNMGVENGLSLFLRY